jgi:molybdopterin synthase catalytic subunit
MGQEIVVTVRLFASLRESVGASRIELSLPPATPVGAVWAHLPGAAAGSEPPAGLRYALNHEWTLPGAPLRDGDEVALVLPVSGG